MSHVLQVVLINVCIFFINSIVLAQNVGIGTQSPTHSLHIVAAPTNPNQDPLRIDGLLQRNATDTVFLVVNPNNGVIRYLTTSDLLTIVEVVNTDDQNIDSLVLTGTVLTTYIEDGTSANIDLLGLLESSVFITTIKDSLLMDSNFLQVIKDSIDSDVDSLRLDSTVLTVYEDGQQKSVDLLGLASDTAFVNRITGRLVEAFFYIEDSVVSIPSGGSDIILMPQNISIPRASRVVVNYTTYPLPIGVGSTCQGALELWVDGAKVNSSYMSSDDFTTLVRMPIPTTGFYTLDLGAGIHTFELRAKVWSCGGNWQFNLDPITASYVGATAGDEDAFKSRLSLTIYTK